MFSFAFVNTDVLRFFFEDLDVRGFGALNCVSIPFHTFNFVDEHEGRTTCS